MVDSYKIYKNARNTTWKVLLEFNIEKLPIQITKIANKAKIGIIKNSQINKLRKGESGITYFDRDKQYIIYDDTMSKGRIRFTIAHELGHIFLGHSSTDGINSRVEFGKNRPPIERAADIFASRLLAPACVLWGLQVRSVEEIMDLCLISRQAAEIRFERMKELYKRENFLTSPLERKVYEQFEDFIKERKVNE